MCSSDLLPAGATLVKIDPAARRQAFEGWGTSLCWRQLVTGVVVASEPFDDEPGWTDIADRSLLVADASGARIEPL